MALNKDWKDYNPDTGAGDPSTPITAAALEDLETRAQAAIDLAVSGGRELIEYTGTALTLSASHFNSEIQVRANSAVTIRIPLGLAAAGATSFGVRQLGTGTVTIVWDAGVEVAAIGGTRISARYTHATIVRTGTNQYVLEGNLTGVPGGNGGGGGGGGGGAAVPAGSVWGMGASVATGVSLPLPTGGTANCTYILAVAYDTGLTPDISSTIAVQNWTLRQAGYGTDNGIAVFTRTWNGVDSFEPPVMTWTGGARDTLAYVVAVYNTSVYKTSAKTTHSTVDATAPTFTSVATDADGYAILAASNSVGLAIAPPAGYTEEAELLSTEGAISTITWRARWESPDPDVSTRAALPLTKPTGSQDGDLHIMTAIQSGGAGALTAPGWTFIRSDDLGGGEIKASTYYRVENGTAFADLVNPAIGLLAARINTWYGVDSTAPINAQAGQTNTANTVITAPTITPTVDGTMLVFIPIDSQGGTVSNPGGWTARFTGAYLDQPYEKIQATAAATGAITGAYATNAISIGQLIALKPSASGGSLALQMADKATTSGSTGSLSATIASGDNRSWMSVALSLGPYIPPVIEPSDSVVLALSDDETGVNVVSVPADTVWVYFAELDNVANPTIVNYYTVDEADATAPGYKYVPHAGTPVVDAIAISGAELALGRWYSENFARIVTNASNEPPPPPPPPPPTGFKKGMDSGGNSSAEIAKCAALGVKWARADNSEVTPSMIQAWANAGITVLPIAYGEPGFSGRLPQLSIIEYTNEPYWPGRFETFGDPGQLAQYFKQFVVECRGFNPNVRVLLPCDESPGSLWSPQYLGYSSIDAMYSAVPDLNNYIGGIAVHNYSNPGESPSSSNTSGYYPARIDAWRQKFLNHGCNATFWLTEYGWSDGDFGTTVGNSTITTYYQQTAGFLAARPWVEALFPYQLRDQNTATWGQSSPNQFTFGIYEDDWTPKGAAAAVAALYGGVV